MDKIVVGVDGSSRAQKAAEKAARLAAALGAELVVVSAFQDAEGVALGEMSDVVNVPPADVAAKIAEQAIEAFTDVAGLVATPRSQFGRPAKVLVDVANEVNAAVIVVGNKRVQGLARVLGSIATDVARQAHCDVYIADTE